jgi:hypothetical protein
MPLKSGYSKATIAANVAEMLRAGHPYRQATAAALTHARVSYFKKYPEGALPLELAFPKTHRLKHQYDANGKPLRQTRSENPVRELDMSAAEKRRILETVKRDFQGAGKDIRRAAKLYTKFTGHEDVRVSKVRVEKTPDVMLAIGYVDGVMYSTVRDGIAEKYIHKFKRSARPLFLVSPDGKQLFMLGGAFDFTERGIVDQ